MTDLELTARGIVCRWREGLEPYEVVPDPPYRLKRRTRHTFPNRCYERAFIYVLDRTETEARLVHGRWQGGHGHAWVEIPGGIVFDGVLNRFYQAEAYDHIMLLEPEAKYTPMEAARAVIQHGHSGPWHTGE